MHSVNNHHPRHHIFWCSNTDQVETALVCNAFIRINRRTNNWHSLNQWHVTGMKVENCISQEDFLFGDDDLRIHGKLSVCPLRTRDLSLAIHAAPRKHECITQRRIICWNNKFYLQVVQASIQGWLPNEFNRKKQGYSKSCFYFRELL